MVIRLKRASEEPRLQDGYRVLVDDSWPHGASEEDLDLKDWFKDVAPSPELRKWLDQDPNKWDEFKKKYKRELDENDEIERLKSVTVQHNLVTLVYDSEDEEHNHAAVLKEYLEEHA